MHCKQRCYFQWIWVRWYYSWQKKKIGNNDSKGEFFDLETENSDTSARGKIVCPDSEITKIWSEVPVIEQVGQTTEVFDHEENTEECEVLNDL